MTSPAAPAVDFDSDIPLSSFSDHPEDDPMSNVVSRPSMTQDKHSRFLIIMHLSLFSMLGCLVRIGLSNLYPPVQVTNNLYISLYFNLWSTALFPQIVGCFIMGAVLEAQQRISKWSSQLPLGLMGGFCGSTTSFSGWILSSVLLFADVSNLLNGLGIWNVLTLMIALFIIFTSSVFSFMSGRYMINIISTSRQNASNRAITAKYTPIDQVVIFLAILGYITTIILTITIPNMSGPRQIILSLIFAPVGTYLRYILSLRFNNKYPMPYGTLLVNIFGTVLISILYIYRYVIPIPGSMTSENATLTCQFLTGMSDGFCGCFTTVSTFVAEIIKMVQSSSTTITPTGSMRDRFSNNMVGYLYAFTSIFVGTGVCVVIVLVSAKTVLGDFELSNTSGVCGTLLS
ncbi:CrcB-like protein-domain-containing protein [Paraphysoderma sedebokerense]|nr:CrcB-like protein-domain-containing protein [Paraphysoderma sedebokerense]